MLFVDGVQCLSVGLVGMITLIASLCSYNGVVLIALQGSVSLDR
jgi:hypothetical protein